MKRVSVWLFLGIVFAAATSLQACGENGIGKPPFPDGASIGPPHPYWEAIGPAHPIRAHLMALGLDEKQRQTVRAIERRLAEDTVRKGAELRIAEIELTDILDEGRVNMGAVEAKVKRIGSIEADIRFSVIKANLEAKALLTPEQQRKLTEMKEKGPMLHKWAGWMRGPARMPPPPCGPCGPLPEDEDEWLDD